MIKVIKLNLWLPGSCKVKVEHVAPTLPFGYLHDVEILNDITLHFYAIESFPRVLLFHESLGQKCPWTAIYKKIIQILRWCSICLAQQAESESVFLKV